MGRKLAKHASTLLNVLPFFHGLTRTAQAPHLMAAAAVFRHPVVRRFAPGLSAVATVGLAAIAVASFVKGFRDKGTGTVTGTSAGPRRVPAKR